MQEKINKTKRRIIALLKWSEKYTKTDMLYLASGGFWLMLAQGTSSFSAFIVTILLTNFLPPETFGQYRFILAVLPLLAVFTLPGLGISITRTVAHGKSINLHDIMKTKIRWGLLGSLLSLIISFYYYTQNNSLFTQAFLILAIFIPFYETFFIYSFYYKGGKDFKTPSIYESISRIIQSILMVTVVLVTKNILALLIVFFVGQIITRLFFYLRTLKIQKNLEIKNKQDTENDLIAYGKKLSLVSVLGIIAGNIDKILVWHFFGAEILALYIVIISIPIEISKILQFIPQLALPKITQIDFSLQNNQKVFYQKLFKYGLILSFLVFFYNLIAHELYMLLFSKYTVSPKLLFITSLLIMLTSLQDVFTHIFYAHKKIKLMAYIHIISTLLQILFFFIFLKITNDHILTIILSSVLKTLIVSMIQAYSIRLLRS